MSSKAPLSELLETPLASVASGETDCDLWVSLGFVSDDDPLDVLHVVCGLDDPPPEDPLSGLFFEHLDQGWSGYRSAEWIVVDESVVELRFTAAGAEDLQLPRLLRLVQAQQVEGFGEAREIFARMARHPRARGIFRERA